MRVGCFGGLLFGVGGFAITLIWLLWQLLWRLR